MNKKLILLFVFTLCLPLFVFAADTCDSSKVFVSNIDADESFQNIEELNDPEIIGNNHIKLNLKFFDVGDGILYSFKVKNESSNDFQLNEEDFVIDSDYITFNLSTPDDDMVVKSDSEKTFYLKVMYDHQVPNSEFDNGVFNDSNSFLLNLSNDSLNNNPKTGSSSIVFLLVFILLFIVFSLFRMKKKSIFIILFSLLLVPGIVFALCSLKVEVSTDYTISKLPRFCVDSCFDDGELDPVFRIECDTKYYDYKSGVDNFIIPKFDHNYKSCYSLSNLDYFHINTDDVIQNNSCYSYFYGDECINK